MLPIFKISIFGIRRQRVTKVAFVYYPRSIRHFIHASLLRLITYLGTGERTFYDISVLPGINGVARVNVLVWPRLRIHSGFLCSYGTSLPMSMIGVALATLDYTFATTMPGIKYIENTVIEAWREVYCRCNTPHWSILKHVFSDITYCLIPNEVLVIRRDHSRKAVKSKYCVQKFGNLQLFMSVFCCLCYELY